MNFQDELAYFTNYLAEPLSSPFGDLPDDEEKHGASSKATGPVKKPKAKRSPPLHPHRVDRCKVG